MEEQEQVIVIELEMEAGLLMVGIDLKCKHNDTGALPTLLSTIYGLLIKARPRNREYWYASQNIFLRNTMLRNVTGFCLDWPNGYVSPTVEVGFTICSKMFNSFYLTAHSVSAVCSHTKLC